MMAASAMLAYARLELIRGLRNRSYLFFSLSFPLAIYLLNTSLVARASWVAEGLPSTVQFMVSMATFGVIMTALSIGPRIAREQEVGWLSQLRVTPLRATEVVAGKIIVGLALTLPVILLIFAAGAVFNGVDLALSRWVPMALLLWLGTAPFAAIAIAIGYVFDSDSANIANSGALLVLAFLGGLFVPLENMPGFVQQLGRSLPSYSAADLAWSVAATGRPNTLSAFLLVGWTIVLSGAALLAFRRAAVAR